MDLCQGVDHVRGLGHGPRRAVDDRDACLITQPHELRQGHGRQNAEDDNDNDQLNEGEAALLLF